MMKQTLKLTALWLSLGLITVISCKKEYSCENCKDDNKPPIANAGTDQTIALPKDSAMLDGSASTDADGTITSYKWQKIAGPASAIIHDAIASKTLVNKLSAGVYQFELTVTDNGGLSAKDTIQVMVDASGNQPPVACAGADQTITLSVNTITLDGSCSADPDNNISSYVWTIISGPSSFSITNASGTQTQVINLIEGVYQFELKVTDADGLIDKDTVQVTVNSGSVTCISAQWQKALGGSGGDNATDIKPTSDGGYVVAGSTSSNNGDVSGNHGNRDFWVVKMNTAGIIEWQKALGGTGLDYAQSIQQTPDGGYVVAGYTSSNDGDVTGMHGNDDAWVVKLTSNGTIQWQKALGGSLHDYASSVLPTSDGGYIIAGYTNSNDGNVTGWHNGQKCSSDDNGSNYQCTPTTDAWIVKLNSTGIIQWQRALGGSGTDVAQSVQATSDGGYIMAGYTYSNDGDVSDFHGDVDAWIVKLNSNGAMQWQKAIGGTGGEWAHSIQPTADGGFIVGGKIEQNFLDVMVVKLNSNGTIHWQKTYGGSQQDFAYSIHSTPDGGFVVAGGTYSNDGDVTGNHGNGDAWIVKLSSAGTIQCQKAFGGSAAESAHSIQLTQDGDYIIAGVTLSNDGDVIGNHGSGDAWLVKLKL